MTWSFNISKAVDKADAKAKVQEEQDRSQGHFPDNAKAIVDAAIDALPDCEDSVINVSSDGHFQTGPYRGMSSFVVNVSNMFAEIG